VRHAKEAPNPSKTIPGKTSRARLPSTGVLANNANERVISDIPTTIIGLTPKRRTTLAAAL
jgi:hypothetical protein